MKKAEEGFIITSHYNLIDNKPVIHLFGRLEDGRSFQAIIESVQPYFFIKEIDELAAKKLLHITTEKTDLKTLYNEPVVKVLMNNPKEVPALRGVFEAEDIPCFEADIRFTQRYFIDQNILSAINISGEEQPGEFTDILFKSPTITPIKTNTIKNNPRMLSFDIETDGKAKTIYSVSLYEKDYEEVIVVENDAKKTLTEEENKTTTFVKDEAELIETFLKRIRERDPDILVGWNVIDFDLDVFVRQAKEYRIPFVLGRDNSETTLRLQSSFFRDSSVYCKGRIVLDGIQLLKSSFVKLDDYKLNTAAKHFLKDSKLIEDENRFQIIEDYYHNNIARFIAYNLKDSKLVYNILEVSGIYNLTIQRSLLTGLHMDNVKASIASFDSLYLRELRRAGYVAPTTRPVDRDVGLGGFVMTSKPGIYTNMLVLDFKSLYPSIMRTFNIDPLDYINTKEELTRKGLDVTNAGMYIVAPNDAVFKNREGILPALLAKLWKTRDKARSEGNELARYAIKILMNSMYGVLASPNSRFHNRNVSNAITYFGQHIIKLTAQVLEDDGYEVIYGDTDSVFVDVKTNDIAKAQEIGKQIETKLNTYLKEHIQTQYKRKSILELEFEKLYTKFFMPKVRGSEEGAKKRYAGLKLLEDGTTKLDFTGLEFVRRDWTEVSKEFQMKLLDLIFKDEPVEEFIQQFIIDLKNKEYDELLVYKKSLRKDIDAYTKTTPPHVKAARLLDKITSTTISYIMTLQGPQPIEKVSSPLDYNHYIEKQIKPIANSILHLQNKNFEDIIAGSEQKGLGDFF